MFSNKYILKALALVTVVLFTVSCSDNSESTSELNVESKVEQSLEPKAESKQVNPQAIALSVHKSPTCGCCEKWISHIDNNGFQSTIYDEQDMSGIKKLKGIQPRYRSCHTAISAEGYAFEGHVPAKFIQQFLKEKHSDMVIGLSVPGMPMGSPGMEVGDKFQPYKVVLLKSDGSFEIYAEINTYEEQF